MLLVQTTGSRQRKITQEFTLVLAILPHARKLLEGDYRFDFTSNAFIHVLHIQYSLVLIIHLGAGNNQDPVKESREEHVLLQAHQMVRHLPRDAHCNQKFISLGLPLDGPPFWQLLIHCSTRGVPKMERGGRGVGTEKKLLNL